MGKNSKKKSNKILSKKSDDFDKILAEEKRYNVNKINFKTYIDNIFPNNDKLDYCEKVFMELYNNNQEYFKINNDDDDLKKIKLGFTYSLYSYGSSTDNNIVLSKPLVNTLTYDEIFLLICHEFAHLINYNIQLTNNKIIRDNDHGHAWKKLYKKLSNKTTEEIDKFEKELDEREIDDFYKYHYICKKGCNHFSYREEKKCPCETEWSNINIRYE